MRIELRLRNGIWKISLTLRTSRSRYRFIITLKMGAHTNCAPASLTSSMMRRVQGKRWWLQGENPFQALATCIEVANAVRSGDPLSYVCCLPVHQDGSCNGLQHYAALGRDERGGAAVNLTPSDKPQDVYSDVLKAVRPIARVWQRYTAAVHYRVSWCIPRLLLCRRL